MDRKGGHFKLLDLYLPVWNEESYDKAHGIRPVSRFEPGACINHLKEIFSF